MQTIQISNRRLQQLKGRAAILKTTPEKLLSRLVKEQIEETVPVVFE